MTKARNIVEDMVICIPSYQRAHTLKNYTLLTLNRGNISHEKIYVFVANEKEKKEYERVLDAQTYNSIVVGKKGIGHQRIFIMQYFAIGQYIVSLDDDIRSIMRISSSNLELQTIITDLEAFFKQALVDIVESECHLWGILSNCNPRSLLPGITFNLSFIIGQLYGFINRPFPNNMPYDPNKIAVKEDYAFTIINWLLDGQNLKYQYIYALTAGNLKVGGCGNAEARLEKNKRAIKELNKLYGDQSDLTNLPSNIRNVRKKELDGKWIFKLNAKKKHEIILNHALSTKSLHVKPNSFKKNPKLQNDFRRAITSLKEKRPDVHYKDKRAYLKRYLDMYEDEDVATRSLSRDLGVSENKILGALQNWNLVKGPLSSKSIRAKKPAVSSHKIMRGKRITKQPQIPASVNKKLKRRPKST